LDPKVDLKSILCLVFFDLKKDLIRTHLMVLSSRKQHRTKVEKLFSTSLYIIDYIRPRRLIDFELNKTLQNCLIRGKGNAEYGKEGKSCLHGRRLHKNTNKVVVSLVECLSNKRTPFCKQSHGELQVCSKLKNNKTIFCLAEEKQFSKVL